MKITIDVIGSNVLSTSNNNYSFFVPITVNSGDLLTYTSNLDLDNKFMVTTGTRYFSFKVKVADEVSVFVGNPINLLTVDWLRIKEPVLGVAEEKLNVKYQVFISSVTVIPELIVPTAAFNNDWSSFKL